MIEFSYSLAQNITAGEGQIKKAGACVKAMGKKKALILSDQMLEQLGTVEKVRRSLEAENIPYETFLDIEANPSTDTVNKAKAVYQQAGADCIVALGGGSPMDVAKAVGVIAVHGGEITEYEGADKVPGDIVPIVAIPTTAGTGSEVTAFAVITDTKRNYKLTVFSYKLLPAYVLLDPELLYSLPAPVAAATGVDALVHAIESYVSLAATPFSDAMGEKAMELIGKNLRRFAANRQDKEAAAAMMMGSNFAGIAFAWARLGNAHAMAHPLGGYFHVAHGVANAILLPVVLEYNALADKGRYEKIYRCIARNPCDPKDFTPDVLVREVRDMTRELGLPESLDQVGVEKERIPEMAEDAMKSGNVLVNPRQTTKADMEMLYHKAFSR